MPGRSPAMTAMTAATLDQLSRRADAARHRLVGPAGREGWHGQRFAKQLQRTREYVAVVRMALSRERLIYDGETIELPLPGRSRQGAEADDRARAGRDPDLPRRDRAQQHELAGEIADGWLPTLFAPEHVAELEPLLEEGAARAEGKTLDDFDIAPTVQVCISDDVETARERHAPVSSRSTSAGWARARRTSTTRSSATLRVRGRGQADPGPLPRRQARGGDGGDPRRADRHGRALRARRPRTERLARLPRRRRRDARSSSPMAFTKDERIEQLRPLAEPAAWRGDAVPARRVRRPRSHVPDHRARAASFAAAGTTSC